MREAAAGQLSLAVEETEEANPTENTTPHRKDIHWWIRICMYIVFVLAGQVVGTLLGRQYFDKGGKSKWLATLVQLAAFPILIPFYFFSPTPLRNPTKTSNNIINTKPPPVTRLAAVYVSLGLLVAVECYLYSVGLQYLPVSTYSLICASQLAFNALFSYFLNSQKFTPLIVNSLVLLTLSSTLLVWTGNSSSTGSKISRGKYIIGFLSTVGASAGFGLVLSLTQLSFQKVIKKQTFTAVMDMIIYQSTVATAAILVGFFASGEWKGLKGEMKGYELGGVSYVMTLVWTSVSWQIFAIGAVGLIFEVSSLFSNAISAMGLPVVPVLAVIFFHEKIDGIKVIALILAIWGFVSYIYQHYLDDAQESENQKEVELKK
ncbi:hypothetical protein SLEP1_g6215 [Rubroshorea leprosula]|uniref:Probable purine permease n=2 Tax=Rubroshorea leprosula TaxID=152421 RepID=A0AAV5HYZ8_9ROSI|nr:hypothetical protein SLEP1_g6215 [Rubroshorea leprosula]